MHGEADEAEPRERRTDREAVPAVAQTVCIKEILKDASAGEPTGMLLERHR